MSIKVIYEEQKNCFIFSLNFIINIGYLIIIIIKGNFYLNQLCQKELKLFQKDQWHENDIDHNYIYLGRSYPCINKYFLLFSLSKHYRLLIKTKIKILQYLLTYSKR